MASVYTNEAALTLKIGAARLLGLLDRNKDGTADTGVLDATIERAGRRIDRWLKQRYGSAIPFAQITGSPATPPEIQEIAIDLVLYDLYSYAEPRGRDAEDCKTFAQEALEAIRTGEQDVAGVARASASEGHVIAVYEAETPTFAGLDV